MERHDILIIGAGFAGIGAAVQLERAGFTDYLLLEQADAVGGTWRENTYPGAACDVSSPVYSFSFDQAQRWSRLFAPQPEIRDYLERCVTEHGLRPRLRLGTKVTSARWDEAQARWIVRAADGKEYSARSLLPCCGGINRPSVPQFEGLEEFRGVHFHSATWNHEYDLRGKKVAVIGTGASAIQIIPKVAEQAAQLSVFQRTAAWVLPRLDHEFSDLEQEVLQHAPLLRSTLRAALFWRNELTGVAFRNPKLMKLGERIARLYLRRVVKDPVLRAKLTPTFVMGCKRILLSSEYYPALQRPNVSVVTEAIARFDERGIVTQDGRHHELDAVIFSTGFHVADVVAPFEVKGRAGADLGERWRREGAEAYLGTTIPGFPNLFLIFGPNTGLGHNSMVFMMESQIAYAIGALRAMRERQLASVELRHDALRRYNDALQKRLPKTVWGSGCASWYISSSGKNTTVWPGSTIEFWARTRRFDARSYLAVPEASRQGAAKATRGAAATAGA